MRRRRYSGASKRVGGQADRQTAKQNNDSGNNRCLERRLEVEKKLLLLRYSKVRGTKTYSRCQGSKRYLANGRNRQLQHVGKRHVKKR
jgi:hypothetical protein